jgi:hypothetical protein
MPPWQRPTTHEPPMVQPPEKGPPIQPELPSATDPTMPILNDDLTVPAEEGTE